MTPASAGKVAILNELFDHIYVCHLERSPERRERFEQCLSGVEFEVWPGVDGRALDRDDLVRRGVYTEEKAVARHWNGTPMNMAEVGCAITHLRALEDIVAAGYSSGLIFEDDIRLVPEGLQQLPEACAQLPDDWDLLYLGYRKNERMGLVYRAKLALQFPLLNLLGLRDYDLRQMRRYYPRPYSSLLRRAGFHFGAHAYAVSARGAQRLLEIDSFPISAPIDVAVPVAIVEHDLQAFIVAQIAFEPDASLDSLIGKRP